VHDTADLGVLKKGTAPDFRVLFVRAEVGADVECIVGPPALLVAAGPRTTASRPHRRFDVVSLPPDLDGAPTLEDAEGDDWRRKAVVELAVPVITLPERDDVSRDRRLPV